MQQSEMSDSDTSSSLISSDDDVMNEEEECAMRARFQRLDSRRASAFPRVEGNAQALETKSLITSILPDDWEESKKRRYEKTDSQLGFMDFGLNQYWEDVLTSSDSGPSTTLPCRDNSPHSFVEEDERLPLHFASTTSRASSLLHSSLGNSTWRLHDRLFVTLFLVPDEFTRLIRRTKLSFMLSFCSLHLLESILTQHGIPSQTLNCRQDVGLDFEVLVKSTETIVEIMINGGIVLLHTPRVEASVESLLLALEMKVFGMSLEDAEHVLGKTLQRGLSEQSKSRGLIRFVESLKKDDIWLKLNKERERLRERLLLSSLGD